MESKVCYIPEQNSKSYQWKIVKKIVLLHGIWIQNFKVVVFPSNFWIQNFKVMVFPLNFWNTNVIWLIFIVILNFAQECYYLKNKVGVVDFTNAQGLVKFQSPRVLTGPRVFETLTILGRLQNLLLPLYFRGNVSYLKLTSIG